MRGVRFVVATMISMPLLAGGARAAAIGPLDTTPPETTIDGGPSEFIPFTQATPTFTFQSSEDGSTFVCSLDGAAFAACDSPFTTPALTDSRHSLAVRAIAPAGNADPTPAVRDFTIDATAPDATLTTKPK